MKGLDVCTWRQCQRGGPTIGCVGQGIDEVIETGVNGCLIKPDDLEELSDTLTGLLPVSRNPAKNGGRGSPYHSSVFHVGGTGGAVLRVYQECRP